MTFLLGEELTLDKIIIDNRDFTAPYKSIENGRYIYEVSGNTVKNCSMELQKKTYFPHRSKVNLDIKEFDEVTEIDLGRIGMLNEIKEDVFVLTWGEHPQDLDSRILCPNGEIVGVPNSDNNSTLVENAYAERSIDNKNGYGPETLSIRRWIDTSTNSKFKIGGHYEFYVNWYKD